MDQNLDRPKKKTFVSNSFKFMLAAASITGTVGLWGAFSKNDVQASASTMVDSPLPTIKTLIPVDSTVAAVQSTSDTSISSLPVVTQAPANTAYQGGNLAQPTPVTQTRSSRP